ncbi:MAG TPA: endonuclease/exonuclease/phosphatase family protein [Polyangiaceae bacterium]|nr:endonuclease/exonuclease/phosphatase family protein [Polyangiaceae bacterium]
MRHVVRLCLFSILAALGCSSTIEDRSAESLGQQLVAPSDEPNAIDRFGAQASSDKCPKISNRFRVATFNAALAPDFAPLVAERRPAVIEALKDSMKQLDLLCVQEFWQEADFSSLVSATDRELPHALRRAPRPGSGTCTLVELGELGQCLQTQCSDASGAGLVDCAVQHCAVQVASLSGGCLGCIMNHLDGDLATCAGAGGVGDPAIFGGAYDVGLLSRYPVIDSEVTRELDSYFVRMAVLYAKIAVPDQPRLHAFCTHLGSALGVVPYAGQYASWEDEHLQQVMQLRAYIDEKTAAGDWIVVLGDLNSGPAAKGLVGEWPSNYAALVADDLVDPYLREPNLACTWCPGNTLVDDASAARLLDHILFGGSEHARVHVERILGRRLMIKVGDTSIATNLSDHYGLRATYWLE